MLAVVQAVAGQSISPDLAAPVTILDGVGPERAAHLARLKLNTVGELLLHRPRRYEDRRAAKSIAALRLGEAVTVQGKVVALGVKYWRQRTRSVFELVLDDGTGRLHCRWWQQPYLEKNFKVGEELCVFGKTKDLKPRAMEHPEVEIIEAGEEASIHLHRIVPVYPLVEGLTQRWLRALIWRALRDYEPQLIEPWPGLKLTGLMSFREAVRQLHFPDEAADAERARQRLALDELLRFQTSLQRRRRTLYAKATAWPCGGDNRLIRPLLKSLGFQLTGAQTRVLREVRADLSGAHPMRRLLQGDVGSGKTVVAACSALMALESGFNVALMAPTEILAEQHFHTFRRWFEPLGVTVHLRTGSRVTSTAAGSNDLPKGAEGNFFVGTHALIQEAFAPERLGLVIIDEQHKFGVTQREQFLRKGRYPHLLVMTATPIPRTLGLTLYGDLDISTLDAPPPGRGKVRTFVRTTEQLPKVWAFVRQKLAEGRQAYVIYPRIEESESRAGGKALLEEQERVRQALAPYPVALLHGRMKSEQKEQVMGAFRTNAVPVLLATTVVEVGMDVPNATVMLIENADQFGFAQLHQLRGRIGRGAHESYCVLLANPQNLEGKERLRVLEQTTDGFAIAEADLRLRGPGDLLGAAQSGLPDFRFADLRTDLSLVQQARELGKQWLDQQDQLDGKVG